jgi:hypothetical protein
LRHRGGAGALEFALVCLPLICLVLGLAEVSYDLFAQSVLDNAVVAAARSVQTGVQQGTSGETSAQFAADAVCPQLGRFLSCTKLTVGVEPIPSGYDYYTNPSPMTFGAASTGGGIVCTGTGGRLMLLQAWYNGPTFIGSLFPSFATAYNGGFVHITASSAGFVNEAFGGGQTVGTGC